MAESKSEKIVVSTSVDQETFDHMESIGAQYRVTRSTVMRNLLQKYAPLMLKEGLPRVVGRSLGRQARVVKR